MVKKTLFFLALIILFSCQRDLKINHPVDVKETDSIFYKIGSVNSTSANTSVINYSVDSLFYNLKSDDNDEITTFLIVKNVYAGDKCFGNFSDLKNREKASIYGKKMKREYHYRYEIFIKDNTNLKKLWSIRESVENFDVYFNLEWDKKYHIREIEYQGEVQNVIITDFNFLKVTRKQLGFSGETLSMNFKIEKNLSWKLISLEKVTAVKGYYRRTGYCKDTISKFLNDGLEKRPKNDINFFEAFRRAGWWRCND